MQGSVNDVAGVGTLRVSVRCSNHDAMQAAGHGAPVWRQGHKRQQRLLSSVDFFQAPVWPLPAAR
jgi:hypothetical protein